MQSSLLYGCWGFMGEGLGCAVVNSTVTCGSSKVCSMAWMDYGVVCGWLVGCDRGRREREPPAKDFIS